LVQSKQVARQRGADLAAAADDQNQRFPLSWLGFHSARLPARPTMIKGGSLIASITIAD
jgi:hypothetical protein